MAVAVNPGIVIYTWCPFVVSVAYVDKTRIGVDIPLAGPAALNITVEYCHCAVAEIYLRRSVGPKDTISKDRVAVVVVV